MTVDELAGLDSRRAAWVQEAWRQVTGDRLRELITGLVDIPSPTGDEGPLAEHIAATLTAAGCRARVQPLDDRQANAWSRLDGDGTGPDLMLYAPIDTLTVGEESEDLPWIGPELRDDMRPRATVHDDLVVGLGASNPKGHAACVMMAAEAIALAGIPLTGDLVAAFGAGGMPTNARPGPRRHTGQGVGCSFLLEQGVWTDYAVIAKPGWTVSWDEVGLVWFEVTVRGTHTYAGSRHRLPYDNAIARAGEVARYLEEWFVEYADRHTAGTVAPQGIVSSVRGGWPRMAAVTPAACTLMVDLRISPDTTPMRVKREFMAAVDAMRDTMPGLDVTADMVLAIAGTRTDPDSWVRRSATAAWEAFEGREHEVILGNSGATDANILRGRGIPTVRVGMPKVTEAPFDIDFARGMNTVSVRAMERLTRHLIRTALDTVTRSRDELEGTAT
ncbi:acetylornithine deacetylase/succinyl-diaminopimelate desuccinylase-like protein [Streptomyces sp. LBL]|uniref:M20 family metallopeptidase n=1 Tax=Streptomyces sp. LBL TaxID=2940562 RepID=UPI0024739FB5|nr:peptidase dimerization domain-containing protein [Streptomyces sp. LBL]MDH6626205.1 acetylornithine deacetylase/succinyl-diaminopimelate desuccinylase-like protein [Streptomyces sp. LBL]